MGKWDIKIRFKSKFYFESLHAEKIIILSVMFKNEYWYALFKFFTDYFMK